MIVFSCLISSIVHSVQIFHLHILCVFLILSKLSQSFLQHNLQSVYYLGIPRFCPGFLCFRVLLANHGLFIGWWLLSCRGPFPRGHLWQSGFPAVPAGTGWAGVEGVGDSFRVAVGNAAAKTKHCSILKAVWFIILEIYGFSGSAAW